MADGAKLSVDKIRSAIIDILEEEELESLTSRIVRNSLEKKFSVGLKDRKKEIDNMLMKLIQEREDKKEENDTANGTVDEESEEDTLEDTGRPPAKKKKKIKKVTSNPESDEDDAKVARKLHEEEKGLGLRTRKQPTKRTPKNATKKASSGEKGKSGFGKMMILSSDLAKIVGADQMPRSEVVKKMWQVIKERELTDPKDKRFHICDDELLKVFGQKKS